jgi:hypothetical protein
LMINKRELDLLKAALVKLEEGESGLPEFTPAFDEGAAADVLSRVAERMQDNYPYYHPQYAGQMLKPPHPVARMAYALSLWVNPNNHALDGGRASSAMEKECIVELGRMFGWDAPLGHLAGGGTMANLEALWVSGRLHPEKRVIASEQAHYTHSRISEVLGIPFAAAPVDEYGRMDVAAIEAELKKGDVGTIVVTIGNTGLGAVEALALWTLCPRYYVYATSTRSEFTPMRPTAATSESQLSWMRTPDPHSTYSARLTPSSLTHTNTDSSPMAVVACCFVTPRLAGYTNTIRRTRISAQATCISVKSRWNVRAQAPRRSRFGLPSNYCRLSATASLRRASMPACARPACFGKSCTTAAHSHR